MSSKLALALTFAAVAAACGPPAAPPAVPGEPAPPAAGVPAVPVVAPPSGPAAKTGPTASGGTAIQPSALLAEAKALGVDFTQPLSKMPLATKKKLMPLFKKSLGFDSCTGCHVEGDFKAQTRNLKVARNMWDHFVVELRDQKHETLFCDSCHAGKPKSLNRGDKDAVRKFMETEYAGKLTRADKKDNECATCHGELVETRIFEKIWGIAAK